MSEPALLDLSSLTPDQRLAFYGALYAVAADDGEVAPEESEVITASLHLDELDADARRQVLGLAIAPPRLDACLATLADTSEEVRLGLMLNLIDVVLADEDIKPDEHDDLEQARDLLRIAPEVVESMHEQVLRHPHHAGSGTPLRPLAYKPAATTQA